MSGTSLFRRLVKKHLVRADDNAHTVPVENKASGARPIQRKKVEAVSRTRACQPTAGAENMMRLRKASIIGLDRPRAG